MNHSAPVLSITGSDSSGSSGIQSDVKTITALDGYALTAITCIATSGKDGVQVVRDIPDDVIIEQVRAAIDEFHPKAVKVGWVRNVNTIKVLRDEIIACRNIVCSPGIFSSKGAHLVNPSTISALMTYIVPESTLVMLRCSEAELMLDMDITSDEKMVEAARMFIERGAQWVLLRGGKQSEGRLTALLASADTTQFFSSYNIEGWQQHGVGGALSTAITTRLAMGDDVPTAVKNAHEYVHSMVVYSVKDANRRLRAADVYNAFMNLLSDNYRSSHDVQFYADHLNITTRYLSQITNDTVSKAPKQIISDYLLKEAKQLLENSRLSVKEISDSLGFSTSALFCKFFKQQTGQTPSEYRL